MLALALATAALAAAPQCAITGPEAKAEQALQEQVRRRRHFGFRSDRAYVRSLVARGAILHTFDDLAGTAAEARYLRRRARLSAGAGVSRYLRRHPAISGWWVVRDDWPRGPYVAVFLTDDSPAQRARIKRLATFPNATRVVRIRYSDQQRDRVEKRIGDDYERLARAGFDFVESGSETATDRVDVSLITKRKDAARYFRHRYGPMVRTHVRRTSTSPGCTRATTYRIAPDGKSLTVSWSDAPKSARIELTEFKDHVAVGIVVRFSVYPGEGDPGGSAVVKLSAPLGDRAVLDAYDGSRLTQTGPSPGDPPCPAPPNHELTPLQQAIEERERYGMNTDPAYVQALLDGGAQFTPDEQRWIESYRAISYQSKVDDYLQHWREDWGGNSVYAAYPNPPILVIRLLRHDTLHTKRLKALSAYPDQLRTLHSTVQRDAFYELPQIIGDAARANGGFLGGYGRDGFFVRVGLGDESPQTVDVDVITARTDAAEYFTRRFGPLVRVRVIGDRFECRGSYD